MNRVCPIHDKDTPAIGFPWLSCYFNERCKEGLAFGRGVIICALSFLILLWLPAFSLAESTVSGPLCQKTAQELRKKIEAQSGKEKLTCQREMILGISAVPLFYERRDFMPAWVDDDGILRIADSLIAAIKEVDKEGLRPSDYHLEILESLLNKARRQCAGAQPLVVKTLVDLDLLLTDAFLMVASHMLAGRVDPESFHTRWVASSPTTDLAAVLQSALDSNAIQKTLKELSARHHHYELLRQALMDYRGIAKKGGWPAVPLGPTMRKGDRNERIRILRERLMISGDLASPDEGDTDLFDDTLEKAVFVFQERHGLEIDCLVGLRTLAALNVPADKRIRQIELNLERWRWIPPHLKRRFIVVNIADYSLWVIENRQVALGMRVVVGKPCRRTPVFSATMKYVVLNPYWHVPSSIAVQEILPRIQHDVEYMTKNHIRVFKASNEGTAEIDPISIDWSTVNSRNFNYKLRQDSGPHNALGRIKFILPNAFSVYLHDTQAWSLFEKAERDLSHGCIRLERPIALASYLLQDDPDWTYEKLLAAIDRGERQLVKLPEPISVHLLYWTAWVDVQQGTVQFREDIYDRDQRLADVLEERPPRP